MPLRAALVSHPRAKYGRLFRVAGNRCDTRRGFHVGGTRPRVVILRVILPPVAVVVAGALFAGFFHEQLLRNTIAFSFMAAWTLGSLLVVRWAGYRLTWQWRFSRRGIE